MIAIANKRRSAYYFDTEPSAAAFATEHAADPAALQVERRAGGRMCQAPADFWARVDKSAGADACWPWTGCLSNGYGRVSFAGQPSVRAHRLAWLLTHGAIPDGLVVCHGCDRPRCCNPGHLFLGTNEDNAADMVAKGRQARGETNGRRKLAPEQVTAARRRYEAGSTIAELARECGVDARTMGQAVRRETWRHVE